MVVKNMNKNMNSPSTSPSAANGIRTRSAASKQSLASGDDRRGRSRSDRSATKNLSTKPSTSKVVHHGKRMAQLRRASLPPEHSLPPRKRRNSTIYSESEEKDASNGKEKTATDSPTVNEKVPAADTPTVVKEDEPPSLIPEQPAQLSKKPRGASISFPIVDPNHAPKQTQSENRPKSAPTVPVSAPLADGVSRARLGPNGARTQTSLPSKVANMLPPHSMPGHSHANVRQTHYPRSSHFRPARETRAIRAMPPPYDRHHSHYSHHTYHPSSNASRSQFAYGYSPRGLYGPPVPSDYYNGNDVDSESEDGSFDSTDKGDFFPVASDLEAIVADRTDSVAPSGEGALKDENQEPSKEEQVDSDGEGGGAQDPTSSPVAVCESTARVADLAICVTQNGGIVLKDKDGQPMALIDSDSADVSVLFRKHKVQVTNLKDAAGDNLAALTLRALATAAPVTSQQRKFQRWTEEEDDLLREAVNESKERPYNWRDISRRYFRGIRTSVQCKNRWTKILQPGLKKTPFSADEDAIVRKHKEAGGDDITWAQIANYLPGRNRDQVRERWQNALDPTLKKNQPWTEAENKRLFELQSAMGNKWTEIAKLMPGRSENQVKNRWHNAKTSQRRMMKNLAKQAMDRERMQEARGQA